MSWVACSVHRGKPLSRILGGFTWPALAETHHCLSWCAVSRLYVRYRMRYLRFRNGIVDFDGLNNFWFRLKLGEACRAVDLYPPAQVSKVTMTQAWIVQCHCHCHAVQGLRRERVQGWTSLTSKMGGILYCTM